MKQLEQGDCVKYPKTKSIYGSTWGFFKRTYTENDILFIEIITGNEYHVRGKDKNQSFAFLAGDLELLEKSKTNNMKVFKKGDRVKRPTRKTAGAASLGDVLNAVGDVDDFEVYTIFNDGEVGVHSISKFQGGRFKSEDLELWEEEWTPKVGDKVRIKDDVDLFPHYLLVGSEATILRDKAPDNTYCLKGTSKLTNESVQFLYKEQFELINKKEEMKPLYVKSAIAGIVPAFTTTVRNLGYRFPRDASDARNASRAFFTDKGQQKSECEVFELPSKWDEAIEYAKNLSEYYKPKKPEFFKVDLGSKSKGVLVYKDRFVIDSGSFEISEVVDLVSRFKIGIEKIGPTKFGPTKFGGYDVEIPTDIRCLRIGCVAQNNLFSYQELDHLLAEHREYFKDMP